MTVWVHERKGLIEGTIVADHGEFVDIRLQGDQKISLASRMARIHGDDYMQDGELLTVRKSFLTEVGAMNAEHEHVFAGGRCLIVACKARPAELSREEELADPNSLMADLDLWEPDGTVKTWKFPLWFDPACTHPERLQIIDEEGTICRLCGILQVIAWHP